MHVTQFSGPSCIPIAEGNGDNMKETTENWVRELKPFNQHSVAGTGEGYYEETPEFI